MDNHGVIYGIRDLTEPERIRYVGLTRGVPKVRMSNHWTYSRKPGRLNRLHGWLKSRSERPEDVDMVIIREALPEEDLNELEKQYIAMYRGRGMADLNHTDGGEGLSGYRRSEESRRAISEKYKKSGGPMARLTWEDVNTIRERRKDKYEPAVPIAEEYGVSRTVIDRILNNTLWNDPGFDPEDIKPREGGFNAGAKLTMDQAREIREFRAGVWVSAKSLAEEYGVSEPAMQGLLKNRTYFDPNYDPKSLKPYEKGRWGK